MTQVSTNQMRQVQVQNQFVPPEGSKAIPLTLDFTTDGVYKLDLQQFCATAQISNVQAIYIDNSANNIPFSATIDQTQMNVTLKGLSQGYMPIIASAPTSITFTCQGGGVTTIFLLNYPAPPGWWPCQ